MSHAPKTLYKKNNSQSIGERIELFIIGYAHIILPILIILLIVMLIVLIVALAQVFATTPVTVVESGNYYNHLKDVI